MFREGLGSPHLAGSPARELSPALSRALADPALQATVPDLEFAHAVLVLDCDPVDDMPILDLRIRKGVSRNGVRLAVATARPGAIGRLSELLVRQEQEVVANAPGIVFVQSLRSGDNVLAVSSWRSVEDMQRYLEQEVTQEFYRALPPHLMGVPSIRTYEVIGPADGPGHDPAGWAGDGGRP